MLSETFYKDQKKIYELLGSGFDFELPETIEFKQVLRAAELWINGQEINSTNVIHQEDAFHENIHKWTDFFFISFNLGYDSTEYKDVLKSSKIQKYSYLQSIFFRWKSETGKHFSHWFQEESSSQSRYLIQDFTKFWNILISKYPGVYDLHELIHREKCDLLRQGTLEQYIPYSYRIIDSLGGLFIKHRISADEVLAKVFQFLVSHAYIELPFNKISSALYGAIANNAANGNSQKPPNEGTSNDVSMITTLLPYCDAMFIDRPMHELFNQAINGLNKINKPLNLQTEVFSCSNKDAFLNYLSEIESAVSHEHLNIVKEIKGNNLGEFYNPFSASEK